MVSKHKYDQVNVRISPDLNDWLNDKVRQTKRIHGSKLPKELILETLLEFLKCQNLDWTKIKNPSDLFAVLQNLHDINSINHDVK